MTVKYYAILTNQGAARLANATMLGSKLNLTQMAVGDANGVLPTPDPAQTKLINQKRIAPLNLLSVDPNNQSQIIAEQIIPENEGGFWIREIGLYDDEGVLIAVANCPETYKPQLQEGSGRTQTIRMILVVTNTEAITLKIDPSVVLATRKYVDDEVLELRLYVDEQMRNHIAALDPHTQYAQKHNPTFTGEPKAPTPAAGNNTTRIATTAFVQAAITALINGAPATLDTLKEIAAAINNDPKFSTTINNALSGKQPLDETLTHLSGKDVAGLLAYLGLQTIKPDPVSTKIFSPDLKKFLLVSNTSWGMWNNDTGAAIALPVTQGGTGQTTVDGVKAAFGIDKLQPKGNYVITDATMKQSLSDALSCKYGVEVADSNNIARVGMYFSNNQAILSGVNGKSIIIPDKAGTMALAGESVSALRLSAPREVTVTTADAWMNFTTSEMVVGIYITPTPGGGAWVLNKVKVATLQAYINGAWVNVTQ
ncbi:phage tail protein [Escherichia coli]|uniref:phage tail protein n=2 Tax=Escherichia coli TaxID=562 RepID=UPI00203F08E8|nr:phage tail protein [Escherichia coli]